MAQTLEEIDLETVPLGRTGLRTSELQFGTWRFGRVTEAGNVNRLGVKPRGFFPWISRTRLEYPWSGRLERYQRSRSGRPQAPMPAVATPTSAPVGVC